MSDRYSRMISALSPVMNRMQAEGFLHLAATLCNKRPDTLTFEDWPTLERTIRDALHGTNAEVRADDVCAGLKRAFVATADGAEC